VVDADTICGIRFSICAQTQSTKAFEEPFKFIPVSFDSHVLCRNVFGMMTVSLLE